MDKNIALVTIATLWWPTAVQSELIQDQCQIHTRGFCLPKNYNKNQRPKPNEALDIHVEFHIEQITSVSDQDFTISLLMYASFFWEDPGVHGFV